MYRSFSDNYSVVEVDEKVIDRVLCYRLHKSKNKEFIPYTPEQMTKIIENLDEEIMNIGYDMMGDDL
jgi:hypothetical protein